MKIKIFGTGCTKCKKLYENTLEAVKLAGVDAEVTKVEDINQIINAGVMITPALSVDGEIKITGKVPGADEIKKHLSTGVSNDE